jgi:hypothetical protein
MVVAKKAFREKKQKVLGGREEQSHARQQLLQQQENKGKCITSPPTIATKDYLL